MKRQGLSERAYADRIGRSRSAVQADRRVGRLVLFDDGSIDAVASEKRRAHGVDPSYRRTPPKKRQVAPGYEILSTIKDPAAQRGMWVTLNAIYCSGVMGTYAAVRAGAPMKVVYAVYHVIGTAMAHTLLEALIERGMPPFDCEDPENLVCMDPDAEWVPDWDELAKDAGEPVDFDAWRAYAAERGVLAD